MKVMKPKIEVMPSGFRNQVLKRRKGKDRSGSTARKRRETVKTSRLAAHGV